MARGQKRVGKSNSNTSAAKKLAPENPDASPEVQNDPVPRPETPQTVISPKCFILKHTFNNVISMADGEYHCGHNEDHFGLNFCLRIVRRDGYLGLYLDEKNAPRQWHLSLEGRVRTLGNKQHDILAMRAMEDPPYYSNGWAKLIKWESISDFLVHNSFIVQFEIRINEMAKLGKKVLRSFDTAMEDVSDVILIVRNQKFYVSKYEANMREITLKGVDPFDMQNYLEFLYLQPSITDDTVEGLLLLADQYETGILKEKCEDFLIKDSKKSLKKKFKMFLRYNCAMVRPPSREID
ncbi:hypothetical protein CAEBREN_31000 [Caenorhabditis brenneri]|uniref:BTB domain-containing protein n=1 Tax=Caenorhabditis brenneri TaxID=135651 RepID=G0MCS0_CAEBE|nr:hypothetical protein CAEBREN_31000 [Caenorhabditis brenneri]